MKNSILSIIFIAFTITAQAQFNIGTSQDQGTDIWGNQKIVHKDQYGNTTGTSTTRTDYFGNTTTTHKDRYGNTTGTSTTGQTDYWGNTTTTHKSNNTNNTIWTW